MVAEKKKNNLKKYQYMLAERAAVSRVAEDRSALQLVLRMMINAEGDTNMHTNKNLLFLKIKQKSITWFTWYKKLTQHTKQSEELIYYIHTAQSTSKSENECKSL